VAAASPAGSARRGQQRPAVGRQGGRGRLQQLSDGDAPVGLSGEERAVNGGLREARQLVGLCEQALLRAWPKAQLRQ
jgi:hypothetical protein